ncbi:hypothetical protein [Salinispora arenicola]|uniref:Uncharacterized protein n=1 Tax=Salinispora arenicola TaxID=168697 RepID=A0A542XM04_SALAC|nr:hypothetical protein [Salinispora arenicola]TQL36886.1 hypothetical protein FB564_2020 [Salinispora arenicola]GIM87076.1 hypothetical protein Sar04_38120 [Salinispora arenicola]
MPTETPNRFAHEFIRATNFYAQRCNGPALITLLATGDIVTAATHPIPAPDTIETALAGMARLIIDQGQLFGTDIAGYAVVLPGERVAVAADRTGATHHIQLPGAPTEPLRSDRWGAICDGFTAMINDVR